MLCRSADKSIGHLLTLLPQADLQLLARIRRGRRDEPVATGGHKSALRQPRYLSVADAEPVLGLSGEKRFVNLLMRR